MLNAQEHVLIGYIIPYMGHEMCRPDLVRRNGKELQEVPDVSGMRLRLCKYEDTFRVWGLVTNGSFVTQPTVQHIFSQCRGSGAEVRGLDFRTT